MLRSFGTLGDGQRIEAITLGEPSGLQLELLSYGAILRSLSFPVRGQRRDLILGFARLEDYVRDDSYVGPVVGRFGNRIANSRFTLDGLEHHLTANEGANHLHGGALGLGKRVWRVEFAGTDRAVLSYRSAAGEEGYPGALDISVSYELGPQSLAITLAATSDAPTPVNLTYHPYFNLAADQHASALAHRLRIPAAHYLPVRAGLIPTGEIAPVAGTPFDFRASRVLAPPDLATHPQLQLAGGYDHCWVLARDADCGCELTAPAGDLRLKLSGSGPGLQFYNGQFLPRSHPSLGNGLILEPQGFPDAPNQPAFPSAILRPGESWRARIVYEVS